MTKIYDQTRHNEGQRRRILWFIIFKKCTYRNVKNARPLKASAVIVKILFPKKVLKICKDIKDEIITGKTLLILSIRHVILFKYMLKSFLKS